MTVDSRNTARSSTPKPTPPKQPKSLKQRFSKGDVWLVSAHPEQASVGTEIWANRPAIIVSANMVNDHAGCVQVVYLTTSTNKRANPVHIPVPKPMDSSQDALALCEQVHAVDSSRLKHKMSFVPGHRMKDVDAAITLSLSLGHNPDSRGVFRKWEDYIRTLQIDWKKEIDALAGQTTDERVEALTEALTLMTTERDAYRALHQSHENQPELMDRLTEVLQTKKP